jgi:hypothetical protein
MRPPIVVRAEGDLLVYDSAEEAARWAEVIDVEDDLYRGWDADGRPLRFIVVRKRVPRLFGSRVEDQVEVVAASDEPDPGELRKELLAYFGVHGKIALDHSRLENEDLIELARAEFGLR